MNFTRKWTFLLPAVIISTLVLFAYYENSLNLLKYENVLALNSGRFWFNSNFKELADKGSLASLTSTCSEEADLRGDHQNVFAFSLYGNFSQEKTYKRYVAPIKTTIENIHRVYPDWIVRIYTSFEQGDESVFKLKETFRNDQNVHLCPIERILEERKISATIFPMTWRFLPLLDPLVDVFMSRDSDSLILDREVAAVEEWLVSPFTFHLMRDHPKHCAIKILGGMWGAKIYQKRSSIVKETNKIFQKRGDKKSWKWGFDQGLLVSHIWALAKNDAISHDSYCCSRYNDTNVRPFPKQRVGPDFVGEIHVGVKPERKANKCPVQCRPAQHPDWNFC